MAQIHNEIRKGWLSESVNRALGRTREGGIERIGETIDAIINPWELPEWCYLRQERICAVSRAVGATAAEYGYSGIVNPVGSRMLVVVEKAGVDSGAFVGPSTNTSLMRATEAIIVATLAAGGPGNVRDTRWVDAISRALVYVGTDPANNIGFALEVRRNATPTHTDFTALPIVLHPGQGALVCFLSVNNAITVNWSWRERLAYPGELV